MGTILLQGAVDREIDYFLKYFEGLEETEICGFKFYVGQYHGGKIVISNTQIGIINSTMSTTLAIEKFKPDIVINQGSCGGHSLEMTKGKLLVCENAVYTNNTCAPVRGKGEGSNSLEWEFGKRSISVPATKSLVELANSVDFDGTKVFGTIGSGDIFSREYDRIEYIRSKFGELGEDMETVASYMVCEKYGVSHIAFRIVANNELLLDPMDKDGKLEAKLQKFIVKYLDKLIETWK